MDDFTMARPEGNVRHPVAPTFRWLSWTSRSRVLLITTVITVVLLGLIAVSPVFLNQIGRIRGTDWQRLSNIGQAYGGASAILAGIALVGIASSLIIQVRQARADRVRLVREQHNELLRIVLGNPRVYAPALGTRTPSTPDEVRQFLFTTMSMNASLVGYEMGIITKQSLIEEILPSAFATEPVRRWWNVAGRYWSAQGGMTRRERQFMRILNDQYDKAIDRPPIRRVIKDPPVGTPNTGEVPKWTIPVSAIVGVGIGILLRSFVRKNSLSGRSLYQGEQTTLADPAR
jgi:hypothetical protein